MDIIISTTDKKIKYEIKLKEILSQYFLDEILLSLKQVPEETHPFIIAGVALFAVRFASPPITRTIYHRTVNNQILRKIIALTANYLLEDPVSQVDDNYYGSNVIPLLLRHLGNQLPFNYSIFGQYGRSIILYHELPQYLLQRSDVPIFDINAAFQKLMHVPLIDYIVVGFVAFTAARGDLAFSGGYFQKARNQGVSLPDDYMITFIMDQLAADQWKLRTIYEKYKQTDWRYSAYDFNPLFVHPIIRPWPKREDTTLDDDRFIAPIPNLIVSKLSEGIYRHMFNQYKNDFATYFGYLFEGYIGIVLSHSLITSKRLSGYEIRQRYKVGKIPDWVVIDNNAAVLIECKAIGLPRKAFATADKDAIDQGLATVVDGLVQLYEFNKACQSRSKGLESLHKCSKYYNIVVTHEPLYIANSSFLTDVIEQKFIERVPDADPTFSWLILFIDELERLQPHLAAGISIIDIIERLNSQSFNDVVEWCQQQTGRTYGDSFLYTYDEKLYKRLNVSNRIGQL